MVTKVPDENDPGYEGRKRDHASHLRLVTHRIEVSEGYQPDLQLDDIRGIATVKRNLAHLIEVARRKKATLPSGWLGGMLLYGPEGTGKVFAVEVMASELHATMHLFDAQAGWDRQAFSDILRQQINEKPPEGYFVLHFENIDAPAAESLLQPVLPYLDQISQRGKVFITASATEPWRVSKQLVQRERLGHVLLVLPPDPPARYEFLEERAKNHASLSAEDIDWIVDHTDGHSFTDLQRLLTLAIDMAAKDQTTDTPVLHRSILRLARRDIPPSSAQWLTIAGHHAMMNEHGGMYDDLLQYFHMQQHRP